MREQPYWPAKETTSRTAWSSTSTKGVAVFLTVESLRHLPLVNHPIDQPAWRHCCWNFLCAEVHRLLLWKFQGAPRFLGLGVPAGTHGTLERNAGRP